MILYVFYDEKGEIHGIWAFWHFSTKNGDQKCSTCVPGDPTLSCFCSVMTLFEETHKYSEQ